VYLYERYSADPHAVLSPKDVESRAEITRDELMANIFYLEERGYVKCMKRYGSHLFAAARITPEGIDLIEDPARLMALFGEIRERTTTVVEGKFDLDVADTLRRLHVAVYEHAFDTDQRNAVLDDLRALKFEMERPAERRRLAKIRSLLEWLDETLDGIETAAREIDLLRGLLRTWENAAQ